jgi:hypothetical protein
MLIYEDLCKELKQYLLSHGPTRTSEITRAVKAFFRERFSGEYRVLCSGVGTNEYLADVLIASFDPKNIIEKGTLIIVPEKFNVFLAIESELGGVSGSSAYGVMKNVVEDFSKLLMIQAEHRMMVMTSLSYTHESDHVLARVETLRQMYCRATNLTSGVLVLHLEGSQTKTQVQALVHPESMRGFEISADGEHVRELSLGIGVSAPTD